MERRDAVLALMSLVVVLSAVLLAARYVPREGWIVAHTTTSTIITTAGSVANTAVRVASTTIATKSSTSWTSTAATTTITTRPTASSTETSRSSPTLQSGGVRVASLVEGFIAPSVEKLVEGLASYATTFTTARVVTAIPTATQATSLESTAGGRETGTNVAIPGVDELDTVKLVGGLLYVTGVRERLVYRVNLTSRTPLEPLEPWRLVSRSLAARVVVEVGGRVVVNKSLEPRLRLRGLVSLGGGVVAVVSSVYWPWIPLSPSPLPSEETLIIVYNGSRASCIVRLPGHLLDARGYNATLWALIWNPVFHIMPLKAPLKAGRVPASPPGLLVAVVDASSCRVHRVAFRRLPFRALLLVEPGGRAYLLASYLTLHGPATLLVKLVYNGSRLAASRGVRLKGMLPRNWLAAIPYRGHLLVILEDVKGFNLYTIDPRGLRTEARLRVPRPREAVHAIRLIDGRLYIVTFRRIDPLFVIDVSDPLHPRLLGWRRGPGFDQILEPLGDGLVVGIGYERGHLRLTVYRVAGNYSLVPVDKRLFEAWGRLLLAPWGYRLFTSGYGIVAYPVVAEGSEKVLVARVASNGTILEARLLEGRRALVYHGELIIIGASKVTVYDARRLSRIAVIPLAPGKRG